MSSSVLKTSGAINELSCSVSEQSSSNQMETCSKTPYQVTINENTLNAKEFSRLKVKSHLSFGNCADISKLFALIFLDWSFVKVTKMFVPYELWD